MSSDEKISRERLETAPGEVYTETIQQPTYEFKRDHYFYPLIETNKAWTVMLVESGIVDEDDGAQLLNALADLEDEGPEVLGEYNPSLEYFYSHMEYQLNERVGEDVAGNINIGRTRPEPLARMVERESLLDVLECVVSLRSTLLDLAEREIETVMPQWTHYQHAQVSTVAHYLLGIVDSLERDTRRLLGAYETVNECTLGCGALSGASYDLDRQLVADLLGFDGYKENTIDCVSGGDHHMEPATAMANMMVTLSRFCQDLYTWHTWEFDFVEIGDEYSGSSSLMPQKKNPYPFEYVRGRAAYAVGHVSAVFETLHNTNFQDIKDVEENAVHPLFDAFEEVERSLTLLDGTVGSATFNAEEMERLAAEGFASCSELAAKIDRRTDLTYRTAHRIVGDLVGRALDRNLDATEVDADLVNESAVEITGDELDIDDEFVQSALDPREFVEAHDVPGGPAPREVQRMIQDRRANLDEDAVTINGRREALENASDELADCVDTIRS
ncbi:argininosuccinate lyase [Natrialbaceae archaeon AArc-T1-2]|uniref:argininosuccinate lyase n=1 Tax=Natrialbaceae archaeon AArc-T1-2 TaxID=3053904 RepID=UPI00255A8B2F|nr:argininosuccinate lyase [Natrialbaceae archaeon AArc-T1-2]WIV67031.1 argininosuccinate lyase [Natrialbaceae archaeon AArc-T1-2]